MSSHRMPLPRDESGLSLAETIVAIGVFAIALLGLNTLLISTIRTSEMARDHATARFLAAHRLEQIKSARYQDGNRDAWNDTSDPCTDIDEVTYTNFPDEDYGEVDLLNGTQFNFRSCAGTPDIKNGAVLFGRSDYPSDAQGDHDYWVNHGQYDRFRREVYIIDSADYEDVIRNVTLQGLNPDARDSVSVETTTPSETEPATNFVKYVLVRVKWKDSHGQPHEVTLTTEKAFYIPAF
ncbi:MAG: hypothetical protein Q9Q40_13345 [Acidobacteriota bacterium]|nr:hypothetical protein [Acidobacteriota bacterium]MDQ7088520.1 hypothetical protein [Acidobacteriota bacterium]